MPPHVEIFFSDPADTMKKQYRQLIQVLPKVKIPR